MGIELLDHFTINVSNLDVSTEFYTDVVGLRKGKRPAFSFGGAWLYCGTKPVVHLIDDETRRALRLKQSGGKEIKGTGALDHIAFRAKGLDDMLRRLRKKSIKFDQQAVPGQRVQQLFVNDPDGIRLEFNFPVSEGGALIEPNLNKEAKL